MQFSKTRIMVSELQHNMSLSHRTVVRFIQGLGLHKTCVMSSPSTVWRSQATKDVLGFPILTKYVVSGYECLEHIITGNKTCLSPYSRDKTCKYEVETSWIPTIGEVQGCEVRWQCDGHHAWGPLRCVFGRLQATRSNMQCRCILYGAGTVMGCHETDSLG